MRLIQVVVKDKHALQVLDLVDEFAVEKPGVFLAQERIGPPPMMTQMMAQTPVAKGHTKGSHTGASKHVDTFVENAKQAGLKQITGSQLVQHMKMGGFSTYSYGYRLNQLLKGKVLKRTRQSGVYEVC